MILNCAGAICTLTQADDIASGAVNTFTADFTFDSDWNGLTKTAVFQNRFQTIAVLLVSDSCTIPWEVMADPGNLYIGCVGVTDSTTILTTNMLKVGRIVIGADTAADPSITPTPDVYDQIVSLLAEKVEYTDIVDDLTTGGSAVPLSAEQGKALQDNKADIVQEDWIEPTLLNNWVNYGGAFGNAAYYKDKFNIVHLNGMIKNGITTVGTDFFILPVGYRPLSSLQYMPVVSAGAFGYLSITSDGSVEFRVGNNGYFSLENISFKAEV